MNKDESGYYTIRFASGKREREERKYVSGSIGADLGLEGWSRRCPA